MNKMLSDIFDEVMSGSLGGDINSDASEEHDNFIILHCWDGRRYILSCVEEPAGHAYCGSCGLKAHSDITIGCDNPV